MLLLESGADSFVAETLFEAAASEVVIGAEVFSCERLHGVACGVFSHSGNASALSEDARSSRDECRVTEVATRWARLFWLQIAAVMIAIMTAVVSEDDIVMVMGDRCCGRNGMTTIRMAVVA